MKRIDAINSSSSRKPVSSQHSVASVPEVDSRSGTARKSASDGRNSSSHPGRNKIKKSHRFRSIFFMALGVMMIFIGALVGIGVGLFNQYLDQLNEIPYLEDYNPSRPSRLFSGDESKKLIADFFSDQQNRKLVPLSEIPDNLINALLGLEDFDFYRHPGISPKGFIRAAYYDIKNWNRRQGGSTITIQLAEDLITNKHLPEGYNFSEEDLKSFKQKIYEIILALKIEKRFTKDEILEFFLNQVFLGGNIWGVAAAADYYFGKDTSELNLKECALFAGMLQGPNAYSPTRNPESAQRRTNIVLQVMLRRGYITEEEYQQAKNEKFNLNTQGARRKQLALYPYFSEAVRRKFFNKQIETPGGIPIDIFEQGVDIESTLNVAMQEIAESALRKGIVDQEQRKRPGGGKGWGAPGYKGANQNGPSVIKVGAEYDARIVADCSPMADVVDVSIPNVRGGKGPFHVEIEQDKTWYDEFDLFKEKNYISVKAVKQDDQVVFQLANDKHVQGALIAVRPSTGEILADVGGYDFNDKSNAGNFIRTTQASGIQPGSAFKPLLMAAVLSDADKKWNIASILQDEKKEYWKGWTPRNYKDEYFGPVTMNFTLVESLNAATIWLLDNYKDSRESGIRDFRNFCRHVFDLYVEQPDLTIALGSSGTTPFQLAQAYSVLANHGNFVRLHMVDKVYQRRDGRQEFNNLLYEFDPHDASQQRITPETAYLVTYMMRNVVLEGTGKPAKDLPFYCVGKTGTTDDCKYAWFAGYSKDILCIVYLGYDDPQFSLGKTMTGSKVALPVWIDFMKQAYEVRPELFGEIEPPSNIKFHTICTKSGAIASPECAFTKQLPFAIGTEPLDHCPIHGQDSLRPYRNEINRFILFDQQPSRNELLFTNLD